MNTLKYKGYVAKINYDPDDEIFFGKISGIKDVFGFHAETAKELKPAFHEAVDHYLEVCEMRQVKPQKSFSGNFVVRFSPELHEKVTLAAANVHKSINSWLEDLVKKTIKST